MSKIKKILIGIVSVILIPAVIGAAKGIFSNVVEKGANDIASSVEGAIYADAVVGTWSYEEVGSREFRDSLFDYMSLSEDEKIACTYLEAKYVNVYVFNSDGTYEHRYDFDVTEEGFIDFFDQVHDKIYEMRYALNDYYKTTYNASIQDMTRDEFNGCIASLYGYDSYKETIQALAENVYEDNSDNLIERGTYVMNSDEIHVTAEGEAEAKYITYKLSDNKNTLKLGFSDGNITCTRAAD